MTKLLYFIACLILASLAVPNNGSIKVPLSFLVYPLALCICLVLFWYICVKPETDESTRYMLSGAGILLFFVTIFLYITYQHEIKKNNELLQMKNKLELQENEREYYEVLEEQNQQLKIYVHDAKKHLSAIQNLNNDPRIRSYVEALSGELKRYSESCHSGNRLLDVMISKYSLMCERKGISFRYDVKTCNLSQVGDTDLVAIIGNVMDNALTSSELSTKKSVTLETKHCNNFSVIIVTNSCDTSPVSNGKQLISTKKESGLHGYGLKSVANTLTKYNGDYYWEYDTEHNEFIITLMIQDLAIDYSKI